VTFGSRYPESESVRALVRKAGDNARAAQKVKAADGAEVVVLAIPWSSAEQVIQALGELNGVILVDPMNAPGGKPAQAERSEASSAGELVAEWAQGARVVKAFNCTGWENMQDPIYGDEPLSMFLCGDDPEAKQVVTELTEELGFEAIDVGDLSMSGPLEGLAQVWIGLAHRQGLGRDIGFRLIHR
jgi:predicted dinucleotide-binding enzyme